MDTDASTFDHYATLGLGRGCESSQIRNSYRLLAKRYHPDLNRNDKEAQARIQALNAAYEILSDPARRRAYDREIDLVSQAKAPQRGSKIEYDIVQEVRLRIEDFLRGTQIEVRVNDPANAGGRETYRVTIPPMTAPGARLRVTRQTEGFVRLRLKVLPGFRFKVRGSALRTDLRISARRAEWGGVETLEGPAGDRLSLTIPKRVKRGEILRLSDQGMPKPRGGRGDLLVRIVYRPEVRVTTSR